MKFLEKNLWWSLVLVIFQAVYYTFSGQLHFSVLPCIFRMVFDIYFRSNISLQENLQRVTSSSLLIKIREVLNQ